MSKYSDVNGTYSTAGKRGNGDARLPACEPEILPPATHQEWRPRSAQHLSLPDPVLRRSLIGKRPDLADYRVQLAEIQATEAQITSLTKTRIEKEQAAIDYERTLAQRELMPGLIEQDRLQVGIGITQTRAQLQQALRQLDQQTQHAVDDERFRELKALEYRTELARRNRVLAEESAKAAHAENTAGFKAQAEEMSAEQVLYEAQRGRYEAEGRATEAQRTRDERAKGHGADDDPPEFRAAMEAEEKRQRIARAAAKREQTILARVDGSESQLTEDEIDALEGIRQAKARAQRQFDGAASLGAIFPYAGEEE